MTITGSVGAMDFFELIQGTRFPLTSYSITAACVVVDDAAHTNERSVHFCHFDLWPRKPEFAIN